MKYARVLFLFVSLNSAIAFADAEVAKTQHFFSSVTNHHLRETLSSYFLTELRLGNANVKASEILRFCTASDTVSTTTYTVCDETDRAQLTKYSEEILTQLQSSPNRVSREMPEVIVRTLNAQLSLLNKQIEKVNEVGVDEQGVPYMTRTPVLNEAAEKLYKAYYDSCLASQATKAGALLQSRYFMSKSGRCRLTISDGSLGFVRQDSRYILPPHKMVEATDIAKSLISLRELLGERILEAVTQSRWVRSSSLSQKAGAQIIATQLLTGSASLGVSLKDDPSMQNWVQLGAQKITDDARDLKLIEKWSDGLMLISTVTGVGSLIELGGGLALRAAVQGAVSRGVSQWLITQSSMTATVAATVSGAQAPVLYALTEREAESLKYLQAQALQLSLNEAPASQLQDLDKQQREWLQQQNKHEMQLILTGLLLPIDAAVATGQLVNILRGTKNTVQEAGVTLKNGAGSLKQTIKTNWGKFRSEVQEQGAIRYVIAPRVDTKTLQIFRFLIDPVFDGSVELANLIKTKIFKRDPLKKTLSMLTSMPLGMIFYSWFFASINNDTTRADIDNLANALAEDRLGAHYLAPWVVYEGMTSIEAINQLAKLEQRLLKGDDTVFDERLQQFENIGFVDSTNRESLKKILLAVRDAAAADGFLKNHEISRLMSEHIANSDWAQQLTALTENYLNHAFFPGQIVNGKSDVECLSYLLDPTRDVSLTPVQVQGLNSLRELVRTEGGDVPMPTVIKLIAKTLTEDEGIARKIEKAKQLGLYKDLANASSRVDFPYFVKEFTLQLPNHKIELKDELDRWNLIFNSLLFDGLKTGFQNGQLTELSALGELTAQIQALNQIFSRYRVGDSLSVQTACQLVYGEPAQNEKPSALLFKIPETFKDFKNISADELSLSVYAVTRIHYDYFIAVTRAQSLEEKQRIFDQALAHEKKAIEAAETHQILKFTQDSWGISNANCGN